MHAGGARLVCASWEKHKNGNGSLGIRIPDAAPQSADVAVEAYRAIC